MGSGHLHPITSPESGPDSWHTADIYSWCIPILYGCYQTCTGWIEFSTSIFNRIIIKCKSYNLIKNYIFDIFKTYKSPLLFFLDRVHVYHHYFPHLMWFGSETNKNLTLFHAIVSDKFSAVPHTAWESTTHDFFFSFSFFFIWHGQTRLCLHDGPNGAIKRRKCPFGWDGWGPSSTGPITSTWKMCKITTLSFQLQKPLRVMLVPTRIGLYAGRCGWPCYLPRGNKESLPPTCTQSPIWKRIHSDRFGRPGTAQHWRSSFVRDSAASTWAEESNPEA